MNLTLEQWFITPIWKTYLDIDVEPLINYLYDLKSKDPGLKVSNVNGWHSGNLPNVPQEHEELLYCVNAALTEVHKQMELKLELPSIVTSHWYNINSPGSYNSKHIHTQSIFSGAFYLQVPEGNSGNLNFYRENMFKSYLPDYLVNSQNAMNCEQVSYTPEKLMLIIFPSCIEHDVSTNYSTTDRISFSFNTRTQY